MITVIVKDCNHFSQDFYDSVINSLQIHQLRCSCGRKGCLHIHAYYRREVHTASGSYRLRIQRLKCSECGRTHAILPSSIVPYQQISLSAQLVIIEEHERCAGADAASVLTSESAVDENSIKSVISRYRRHWREKLRSQSIPLRPVIGLVRRCFSFYSMQFMQIRRTANILFVNTT